MVKNQWTRAVVWGANDGTSRRPWWRSHLAVRDHVFVIEFRRGARLLMEATNVLGFDRHLRRQNLERDDPIELRVARAQNRRHAADANRFEQLEMSELAAAQIVRQQIIGANGSRGTPRPHPSFR